MSPQLSVGRPAPRRDAGALVVALAREASPRLTWYGPDGARVELSGRVLVNWVAKAGHLLLEEADVGPGSVVALRVPGTWVEPVLLLTAWYLGAEVVTGYTHDGTDQQAGPAAEVDADVVIGLADGPPARPGAVHLVVPRTFPGTVDDLPDGAVDVGAEISSRPDSLPPPGPGRRLDGGGADGRRLLGPGAPPEAVVAVWAAGGSVVLHEGLPPAQLARVAQQERTDP